MEPDKSEIKLVDLEQAIYGAMVQPPRITVDTLAKVIFENMPEENVMSLVEELKEKLKVGKIN